MTYAAQPSSWLCDCWMLHHCQAHHGTYQEWVLMSLTRQASRADKLQRLYGVNLIGMVQQGGLYSRFYRSQH